MDYLTVYVCTARLPGTIQDLTLIPMQLARKDIQTQPELPLFETSRYLRRD